MSAGEELNQYLTKSSCYCLNEDSRSNYNNLFMGDHTLVLKSDADEQLLLQLAFQQTVNIRRVQLGLPADDSCPQTVKLFANKLNLGFSEASELEPTQTFTFTPQDRPTVITLDLFAAKWQRVESVTIFVESNHGADVSSLYSLKLFGSTVHGTNVSGIHQL
eukprot:gene17471-20089_t